MIFTRTLIRVRTLTRTLTLERILTLILKRNMEIELPATLEDLYECTNATRRLKT